MGQYKIDEVVLVTGEELIEGTLHYLTAIRFTDAFNSPHNRENPFVVLTKVTGRSRLTGTEVLKSGLLRVERSSILMAAPRAEISSFDQGRFGPQPLVPSHASGAAGLIGS
jgi:hypothetical protein